MEEKKVATKTGARLKKRSEAEITYASRSTPATPGHHRGAANFDGFHRSTVYTSMLPGGPIAAWSLATERAYLPEQMRAVEVHGDGRFLEPGALRRNSASSSLPNKERRETESLPIATEEAPAANKPEVQKKDAIDSSNEIQTER